MTDRYSDDHKIVVSNGTGTLTLDSDVEVTGDIAISGSVTGDLSFSGAVTVAQQIELNDLTEYTVAISAAEFTSAFDTSYAPSTSFINTGIYVRVSNPDRVLFFVGLSGRIPNGSKITSISMFSRVDNASSNTTLTLYRQEQGATTSTAIGHVGPENDLTMTERSSGTIALNNSIDYSSRLYYLKLDINAAGADFAYFAGCKITYKTKKLGQ